MSGRSKPENSKYGFGGYTQAIMTTHNNASVSPSNKAKKKMTGEGSFFSDDSRHLTPDSLPTTKYELFTKPNMNISSPTGNK